MGLVLEMTLELPSVSAELSVLPRLLMGTSVAAGKTDRGVAATWEDTSEMAEAVAYGIS